MSKKKEILLTDDNNRRDRDNKADRDDIRKMKSTETRRGELGGHKSSEGKRTKSSSEK